MKAVIIAAGMGKRMRPVTDAIPKCMLDFNGRPLLELHLEVFRSYGIRDISVVKGYMADKIRFDGIKYYMNDRYEENNILNSLFYAEKELDDDIIISYSDIYYRKDILGKLAASKHHISIVVDLAWKDSYTDRSEHPIGEAENVRMGPDMKAIKIGKRIDKGTSSGEFIGMMKLSKTGCEAFKRLFNTAKKNFWDRPFHEAATFQKAYLTDMIQEAIDNNIDVHCVTVEGGWKEIDTIQDYHNLKNRLAAL